MLFKCEPVHLLLVVAVQDTEVCCVYGLMSIVWDIRSWGAKLKLQRQELLGPVYGIGADRFSLQDTIDRCSAAGLSQGLSPNCRSPTGVGTRSVQGCGFG